MLGREAGFELPERARVVLHSLNHYRLGLLESRTYPHIHYFVPAAKIRLRDVWVGSILTGLLWQLVLNVFSWYLAEIANLTVHGSIATVVTFLLWIYVSAVIFLFGVEFSAAWVRLQGERRATLYP